MGQTRKLIVDGIEVREAVIGVGDPVLMAHGWGANIELLRPLAERLNRLGYQTYVLDLPGFGESAPPSTPFSIFDYARFCMAYLDRHGLDGVHFFGHSLGGRIGLVLGSDFASRIRSMVLSNSAGVRAPLPRTIQIRQAAYKSIRKGLQRIGAGDSAAKLRQRYNQRYASADYLASSAVMQQTLVKIVNQDLVESAKRVSVPTVLIWGDKDEETPLWMGRKLEEAIPDSALIVYEGVGHYAYLDLADRTASIMHALFQAQCANSVA